MPTDRQMVEFCYSMLKQLDLKPIDWKTIAAEHGISNGHAARMRFSRFRQQMEGKDKTGSSKGDKEAAEKKTRGRPKKKHVSDSSDDSDTPLVKRLKRNQQVPIKMEKEVRIKEESEPEIKLEPNIENIPVIKIEDEEAGKEVKIEPADSYAVVKTEQPGSFGEPILDADLWEIGATPRSQPVMIS